MLHCRQAAQAPLARFESAVAVVRGQMFVIGGHYHEDLWATDANYCYDPVSDCWSERSAAPVPISHINAQVVDDRYIWLVGGFVGNHPGRGVAESYRYDVVEDCWESGPPLPKPRASGGLSLIGRALHYFGGLGTDRATNYDDHWMLDVDDPVGWVELTPAPEPRTHAAVATIGHHSYMLGGHFGHDLPETGGIHSNLPDLDLVHRYDSVADRWTELAPLPSRRSHFEPGTFVHEGKIVCVGGRNNSPLARSRYSQSRVAHYLRSALGHSMNFAKRLFTGNEPAPGGLDDIVVYDPARDRWATLGKLPGELYAPAATVIDGEAVITNGGKFGWQNASDTTLRIPMPNLERLFSSS